jgi:hypothetical protein
MPQKAQLRAGGPEKFILVLGKPPGDKIAAYAVPGVGEIQRGGRKTWKPFRVPPQQYPLAGMIDRAVEILKSRLYK